MKIKINESEEIRRGQLLAKILKLKKKNGFYHLSEGFDTKTDLGLFRVIERIVLDGE